MNEAAGYAITFPEWYAGPYEMEAESKGYLRDVKVDCQGTVRWLTFIDEYTRDHDAGFRDEPVVVVAAITREGIEARVGQLVESGEISRFEPSSDGT